VKTLLPALFLGLLTFSTGTFPGGATFAGASLTQAAALAFCLVAAASWRDPLGLGTRGRWLPLALVLVVAASWWASPVERAGRVGLLLLPAFLLLPAAVAECWRGADERRRGIAAISLLTAATALWALVDWGLRGYPRAAMPLGHHNLLAGWLVLVWPLSLPAALRPGTGRWPALAALALTVPALLGTGSLVGLLALAIQLLLVSWWWRPLRIWLLGSALVTALLLAPRGVGVLFGTDLSAGARSVYWHAGWRGVVSRPLLGWGPGSVPWTVGDHIWSMSGVSPPSEIVGDLHSLPLQVLYELGLVGLLLSSGLFVWFVVRRSGERIIAADGQLLQASLVALVGGVVFFLGNAPLAVTALPAAAALVAGAALASGRESKAPNLTAVGKNLYLSPNPPRARAVLLVAYVLPVALFLIPLDRAQFHYQCATTAADDTTALHQVTRAQEIDPAFPLYRARAALLQERLQGPTAEIARQARLAAEQAPGVGPLWLAAGTLGRRADESWAAEALERAWQLDRLSGLVAFHLMRAKTGRPQAVALGAHALLTEPRLAAAVYWEEHQELWDAVIEEIHARTAKIGPKLEPLVRERPVPPESGEPVVLLALTLDEVPAVSFSLYAFRRSPWPTALAGVPLRSSRLARAD
jgi:O-antigen ligase